MVEVLFKIDGIEQKEMAVFDSIEEMQSFLLTYTEEVLENYPNATDIRLGNAFVGI